MPHPDTPFKGILSGLQPAPLVWRNEWPDKEGIWLEIKGRNLKFIGGSYWGKKNVKNVIGYAIPKNKRFAGPITPPEMPK